MNYRYWFNPNIGNCNVNPLEENKLKYRENLKLKIPSEMEVAPRYNC